MSVLIKGTNIEDLQRALLMFRGHEIMELTNHGDLIDRDDIRKQIPSEELASRFAIENAYVVIPAERSEE